MTEIIIILALIVANGVLAMSEMAVVSARKPRLQHMAEEGNEGAAAALELANEPSQFLSTVQAGITVIGILAGAFGGATVAEGLATWFARVAWLAPYSDGLAVVLVVMVIAYVSLILGELTPKQLALRNAEKVAASMARPMRTLARWAGPVVHLLSVSTDGVLRLLRVRPVEEPAVTEEEVRIMLEQGAETGVFAPFEEEIVGQVFRLADRKVSALVTPRLEIVWLDVNDSEEAIRTAVIESGYSRYPVAEGQLDHVVGIVLAKDLLAQSLAGRAVDLSSVLRPVLFVPDSMPALEVVQRFKTLHAKLAVVIDEFGGVEGLVTVDDILTAIVGEIPESGEQERPGVVQREDGSWLLDGKFPLDEFQELFELRSLPEATVGYQTVGGLVLAALGQIPSPGDHFEWGGLRVEVVDMDGRRVDKVLVQPVKTDAESAG
jgi:putative hemolysin